MPTVNGKPNDVFEEQVFTDCTVIQYTNLSTGEKEFVWWDNAHPESTFQQEEE